MKIHIEESRKLRRASACIRDGGLIHVKVPRHWSRDVKGKVVEELVERIRRKDAQEKALLAKKASTQPRITIQTDAELEIFVRGINAETFGKTHEVPLGKIQIGNARYNHLAQVNLRTKTMTVSKYCLSEAPAEALRYLIVHELAHYFEAGHGPRFWALVAQHVPDYKLQSRIMKAFHHQAVIQETMIQETGLPETTAQANLEKTERSAVSETRSESSPKQSEDSSVAIPTKRYASTTPAKPKQSKQRKRPAKPTPAAAKIPNDQSTTKKDKTGGLIPGFVKQLFLWTER